MKFLTLFALSLAFTLAPAHAETNAGWAIGSELNASDFQSPLVQLAGHVRRPARGKRRGGCVPRGGSCWGGNYGAECCSGSCPAFFIFSGYCD